MAAIGLDSVTLDRREGEEFGGTPDSLQSLLLHVILYYTNPLHYSVNLAAINQGCHIKHKTRYKV